MVNHFASAQGKLCASLSCSCSLLPLTGHVRDDVLTMASQVTQGILRLDSLPAFSLVLSTGKDFKLVAQMLLDARHNVVDWNALAMAVGHAKGAGDEEAALLQGEKAIGAMVAANVLAKRSKSVLSFDIPDEAFVDGEPVACAMTPVHLYVLRKMQKKKRF